MPETNSTNRVPQPSTAELAEAIVIARHRGYATYEDAEVERLLSAVAVRFPGMEILGLRPFRAHGEHSIVILRWDQASILRRGIVRPEQLPSPPKRKSRYDIGPPGRLLLGSTERTRGDQLMVRVDVADDIGNDAPLALFRPSVIRSLHPQRYYLRLVGAESATTVDSGAASDTPESDSATAITEGWRNAQLANGAHGPVTVRAEWRLPRSKEYYSQLFAFWSGCRTAGFENLPDTLSVEVNYRGHRDDLIAAGCITEEHLGFLFDMFHDDLKGGAWCVSNRAGPGRRGQISVTYITGHPKVAASLPGVCELFPEGFSQMRPRAVLRLIIPLPCDRPGTAT